jgi:hypothetical protein
MRLFCFFLILVLSKSSFGQDPTNTCFQYGRMEFNPSYGIEEDNGKLSIRNSNRTSFLPIRGPFNFTTFSLNYSPCRTGKTMLGIGYLYTKETQGDGFLKTQKNSINLGISIPLDDGISISIGLRPGLISQVVDWNEFTFTDQLDPIRGIVQTSSNQNAYFDKASSKNWDWGIRMNFYRGKKIVNLGSKIKKMRVKRPNAVVGYGMFNAFTPQIGLINGNYQLARRHSFFASMYYENSNNVYKYFTRFEMQNNFKYGAMNMEAVFDKKFSLGFGLKMPIFNSQGNKNNLFPSVMFGYQTNSIVKVYGSVETNFLGVSLTGKTNSFEVGIIITTLNSTCGAKSFKGLFSNNNKGNKIKAIDCPVVGNPTIFNKGKILTF